MNSCAPFELTPFFFIAQRYCISPDYDAVEQKYVCAVWSFTSVDFANIYKK